MPEKRTNSENIIRQKMEGHTMPLPKGMWAELKTAIPAPVPPAPPRRRLFWWWFPAVLLLLVGSLVWLLADTNSTPTLVADSAPTTLSAPDHTNATPETSSTTNNSIDSGNESSPVTSNNSGGSEEPLHSSSIEFSDFNSSDSPAVTAAASGSSSDVTNDKAGQNTPTPSPAETTPTEHSNNPTSDLRTPASSTTNSQPVETSPSPVGSDYVPTGSYGLSSSGADVQPVSLPSFNPDQPLYLVSFLDAPIPLAVNYPLKNPLLRAGRDDDPLSLSQAPTWSFAFGATGGPELNYRDLRISADPVLETHRNDHEKRVWMYRFEGFAEVGYGKWVLKTGAGITQKGEHYAFHHDTIQHETNNSYQYVSVPLRIGRRMDFLGAEVTPMVGLRANFLQNAEQSWVDPVLLNPVLHSNVGDHTPFRQTVLAWTFEAQLAIPVSPRFDVLVVPGYTSFIQSIYKDEVPLVQRPYSFDANVGLRYRLR